MANAAILTDGTVIQTEKLDGLKYNLDGFLIEFKFIGTSNLYKCVKKNEFRSSDIENNADKISAGYYLKDEFLKYLAKQLDFSLLKKFTILDYPIEATNLDTITVERLSIIEPYAHFYDLEVYKFAKQTPSLDPRNFQIAIPPGLKPQILPANNHNAEANLFYNSRINLVNTFSDDEKYQAAKLISEIALVISMINTDVFSFFTGVGGLNKFVLDQNNEWKSGNILINPTLDNLNQFKDNLFGYYKNGYSNQLKILSAEGYEKLYWLALALSKDAISVLPVNDKIELLQFLIKNKLSTTSENVSNEELVIKICLSFNQINVNEIDPFLDAFLNNKIDASSNKTLYELLYLRMSTSTNFKVGLLGLSSWIFGTPFEPTTTKDHFVRAIYYLWEFSKYNPLNDDGSIKPNTLSFQSSDPALAKFSPNPTIPNALFTYTHYVAYTANITGPFNDYYTKYPEAAPLLMPYESEKFLGLFFDNFKFIFDGKQILAYEHLLPPQKSSNVFDDTSGDKVTALFGTYKIFQPVSLLSTNIASVSAIATAKSNDVILNGQKINSFIPVFVLEYIGSANGRNNAETLIGYVADVATTFTGIGQLSKLAYLRWAGLGAEAGAAGIYAANSLDLVVAGVEFTTGVMGIMANFVECGPDDAFCNEVKTFIAILQMASLSIHAVDLTVNLAGSLSELNLKRAAARIIAAAGGGADEAAIKQNIITKLGQLNLAASAEDLDKTATVFYQSGHLYSFSAALVATIINTIKRVIIEKKFLLSAEYTDAALSDFIKYCDTLNIEQREIEDLVVFSNRTKRNKAGQYEPNLDKYVSPDQLKLRANYLVNEVEERGYPAGFSGLLQYRQFGNALRNILLENLDELNENLSGYLANADYVVKGSACLTWKDGDVDIYVIVRPTRPADDIDIGVTLDAAIYDKLSIALTNTIRKLRKEDGISPAVADMLIRRLTKRPDKLQYNEIFKYLPNGNSNFYQSIVDACEPYTGFKTTNEGPKITFAILKKGGKYDNLPEYKLKF